MPDYTNDELSDMHMAYGFARGVATRARETYAEWFPRRILPDRKTFESIDRRLRENGSFEVRREGGRIRSTRTPQLEDTVLNAIERNPRISSRELGVMCHTSQSSIVRIIHQEKLHPYHIQRVQALLPADFPARIEFCRWYREQCVATEMFFTFSSLTRHNFHEKE